MNSLNKITGDKKVIVGLLVILLIVSTIQGVFLIKMYRAAHHGLSDNEVVQTFTKDFGPKDNFFKSFNQQTWNPAAEFQNMRRQMNRMLNDSYNRFRLSPFWDNGPEDIFLPQTDILDKKDSYIIKMNIPGSDKTKIETNIKGDTLTIKATTEIDQKSKGEKYLRMERGTGTFERSISLPGPVKGAAMKTEYKNGVLTIILPKAKG